MDINSDFDDDLEKEVSEEEWVLQTDESDGESDGEPMVESPRSSPLTPVDPNKQLMPQQHTR